MSFTDTRTRQNPAYRPAAKIKRRDYPAFLFKDYLENSVDFKYTVINRDVNLNLGEINQYVHALC